MRRRGLAILSVLPLGLLAACANMPMDVASIRREHLEAWLDTSRPADEAMKLLQPYGGGDLAAAPVTTKVNNARYDAPDCTESPSS